MILKMKVEMKMKSWRSVGTYSTTRNPKKLYYRCDNNGCNFFRYWKPRMYEYKVVIKRLGKLSEGLEVNDDLGWKLISLLQN